MNEILIGLVFFDPEVSICTKFAMVAAFERQGNTTPQCRVQVAEQSPLSKELSDFVSSNTQQLFVALNVYQDFLMHHPSEWEHDMNYLKAKNKVSQLKVVNDTAERGIAVIQSFNAIITSQDEQQQYLLQVAEQHGKQYPDAKKSTIMEQLKRKCFHNK